MSNEATSPNGEPEKADEHRQEIDEHEAYEYWGYLFKPDKTGTDKLKGLLRGLKELMNKSYEPSDNPDLTPTQLATFYRDLHGNYDRLFLGTPSESIAFIYKSLGCLHSLQPLSHSTAFTEPTVPALKTEGWIMWQTIQLLLGPEEHSGFLMEAVQKWEVQDPATGEVFPKILPRQCFPMEPDKHMVAWYEGVSERLRREAADEENQRELEAEQAEVRRLQYRKRDDANDDESVDSRKSALAYFRDPLYRQDGRPTIVTRSSKRPLLSPRRSSMKDKAKEGATTVGHVIRNIGSPHLWEGRHGSKSESRDHSKDRRRRSSLPENKYNSSRDAASYRGQDSRVPSHSSSHSQHRREGSRRASRPDNGDEEWNADDEVTPVHSREEAQSHRHHLSDADQTLRHSRSAEPTPSQKEITDYFYKFDDPTDDRGGSDSRNVTPNGIGPGFGPSASPLFASHIAKQPQPQAPRAPHPQADYGPARSSRQYGPSDRRPYSRSPHHSSRSRDRDDRRHGSHDRRRYDRSPNRLPYNDGPTSMPSQSNYPPIGSDPNRSARNAPSYQPGGPGLGGAMPTRDRRRSGRMSGSDLAAYNSGEDVRRGSGVDDVRRGSGMDDVRRGGGPGGPSKQARFASVSGVDGRRYPNESPWR